MVISYYQQILFCHEFVLCKVIFYTEKNHQHDERDAKSGELGQPVCAIFPKSVLIIGQKGAFTLILSISMLELHTFLCQFFRGRKYICAYSNVFGRSAG